MADTAGFIAPTARISTSAIRDYIRAKIEPIFRESFLLGAFKEFGRISYGHGGEFMEWRPRIKRRRIKPGNGNLASIQFPITNTRMKCTLPWRVYDMGEAVSKFEKLVTQNKEQTIFKIFDTVVSELTDDFTEDLRLKLYKDGNATGSQDIHGLESIFSYSGALSNGKVGAPNDNYADHYTTLGSLGGDWTPESGDAWPTGTGDTEYSAWSPIIVDVNSANFTVASGAVHNWQNQWRQAIRYGAAYLKILQGEEPDFFLISPTWLLEAKQSLDANERFIATPKSRMVDAGFKTLTFEGQELQDEYGTPTRCGYGLVMDHLEIRSMQKGLIDKVDDQDITTSTTRLALDSYLQLLIDSPAYQIKLAEVSVAGT